MAYTKVITHTWTCDRCGDSESCEGNTNHPNWPIDWVYIKSPFTGCTQVMVCPVCAEQIREFFDFMGEL